MTYASSKLVHFKLFPPYLPQANKHGIGVLAAANLAVNIDPYPDMDIGDLIELFWGESYVASKLLTASDIGYTSVLRVPESFLQTGKARIYYSVRKIGGTPVQSPSSKLWVKLEPPGGHLINTVLGENQGLAALSFSPAVLHRGISRKHLNEGIELAIEAYPNMDAYDEITLRWGDSRIDLPIVTSEQVGKAIRFHLPGTFINDAGIDEEHEVTYCVIDRVGNNSMWAPPRSIKVMVNDYCHA
ncbi:MAG TPA: hypothetical protein VGC62_20130 [Pseudomonas sp.]|uniref:hypothetical protein n=1 Tax=Pseudomonas sp. TaxID=306 RepID=UPI002EDB4EE8